MEPNIEMLILIVFFVPMAVLVAMNVLLYRVLPDIAAPWARVAASLEAPQPAPQPAVAMSRRDEISNDEEALEAA